MIFWPNVKAWYHWCMNFIRVYTLGFVSLTDSINFDWHCGFFENVGPNWIKICCTGTDFPYWANFHFHELAVNQGVKMHVWFALRYCWADRLGWQTVVRKPTFGLLEGFLRFWLDNWSWQKYAMSLKMVIVLHIVLKKWSNRCIVMYMYKKIIIYWNRITIRM